MMHSSTSIDRPRLVETSPEEGVVPLRDIGARGPLAVRIFDAELSQVLWASPAMEEIWRRPAASFVGPRDRWVESIHPEDRDAVLSAASQLPDSATDLVYRILRPDGSRRYVREWAVPVRREGREPLVVALSLDVTKESEEKDAAAASSEVYRTIVERASEGLWFVDAAWRTTLANEPLAALLGEPSASLLGRTPADLVLPDDRPSWEEIAARIELGVAERGELRLLRRSGAFVWASLAVQPILSSDGRFEGAVAVVTDVTARRSAEVALEDHSARLELLHEIDEALLGARGSRPIAQTVLARLLTLSGAARIEASALDRDRGEAVVLATASSAATTLPTEEARHPLSAFAPLDYLATGSYALDARSPDALPEAFRDASEAGLGAGICLPLQADGGVVGRMTIWFRAADAPLPDRLEVVKEAASHLAVAFEQARLRESLEEKATALARSNGLLQAVMDGTSDHVFVKDLEGRYLYLNPAAKRGPLAPLVGRTAADWVPDGLRDDFAREDREVIGSGQIRTFEHEFVEGEGGKVRVFEASKGPYRDENGRVAGIVGIARDVSESRLLERERRRNERRLLFTLELSHRAPGLSEKELIDLALEHAVSLTESRIGYLHLMGEDQQTIHLTAWNRQALEGCTAPFEHHYPLASAGVWADCVRERRPVIHNDLHAVEGRKGYPEGHAHVARHASVPVFDGDQVRMILGVGNKGTDYDTSDTDLLQAVAADLLRVVLRRRAEEKLRRHAAHLEILRDVDSALLRAQTREQIALAAVSRLRSLVGCDRAFLVLASEAGDRGLVLAVDPDNGSPRSIPLSGSDAPWFFSGENHLLPDLTSDPSLGDALRALTAPEDVSAATVPLRSCPCKTIGRLGVLWNVRTQIEPEPLAVLNEVADHLAIALEQLRLREQVATRAAELAESNERYQSLVESIDGVVWEMELEGWRFTFVSARSTDLLGIPPADWTDAAFWSGRIHPEDRHDAVAFCQEQTRLGKDHDFEYRFLAADGRYVWLRDLVSVETKDGRAVRLRGVMIDVTARKDAEEALRQRSERLGILREVDEAILRSRSPMEIARAVLSRVGRLVHAEGCSLALLEDGAARAVARDGTGGSWPEGDEPLLLTAEERGLFDDPEGLLVPDLGARADLPPALGRLPSDVRGHASIPLRSARGHVLGYLSASSTDVHRLGRAELRLLSEVASLLAVAIDQSQLRAALVSARQRFEGLVDAIDGIVWEGDPATYRVRYMSRQAERLLGYPPERWIDDPEFWPSLIHPDDRERVNTLHRREVAACRSHFVDYRMLTRDGRTVHVRDHVSVTCKNGIPVSTRGILVDVTAEKEAALALSQSQEQLRSTQKMEAIGRMAGGVAHDFNNLLTAIVGSSRLLSLHVGGNEPARRHLDTIASAADRAAELTNQLLAISSRQPVEPKVLDVRASVTEIARLLDRLLGANVELVSRLAPEPLHVKADPAQLTQILLNLAVNARDAMPGGGRLTIEASGVPEKPGQQGPLVRLAVSDTGAGMDEETLSHAFEPFFTTKARGAGTGLGLSIVHGVVEQCGGCIRATSSPRRGTTFEVLLPRVEGPPERAFSRPAADVAAPPAETILVVEDGELLRNVIRDVLQEAGFRVLACSGGEEALGIVARTSGIDLVLTDVQMPLLGGRELAARLRESGTSPRVLLMSGYAAECRPPSEGERSRYAVLQKPFTPEQLFAKVREALREPPR